MSMRLKRSVQKMLMILLICMIGFRIQIACHGSGSDEASQRIQEADGVVREAFSAVLKVEEVGANISGLMAALNDAGTLLAEAEVAYRNGNSSEAAVFADSAFAKADGVMAEASSLGQADPGDAFLYSLGFSVLGALAFLVVLFLVWSRFKRVRAKKLYGMSARAA